jgi:hypothetical protein
MESWDKAKNMDELESLFNMLTPPPLS